jgi:hypothetical protein
LLLSLTKRSTEFPLTLHSVNAPAQKTNSFQLLLEFEAFRPLADRRKLATIL